MQGKDTLKCQFTLLSHSKVMLELIRRITALLFSKKRASPHAPFKAFIRL